MFENTNTWQKQLMDIAPQGKTWLFLNEESAVENESGNNCCLFSAAERWAGDVTHYAVKRSVIEEALKASSKDQEDAWFDGK